MDNFLEGCVIVNFEVREKIATDDATEKHTGEKKLKEVNNLTVVANKGEDSFSFPVRKKYQNLSLLETTPSIISK